METKEMIEVMQAYVDGKSILLKCHGLEEWKTLTREPAWDWLNNDYAVKPDPIHCYITVLDGRIASTVHATEKSANDCVHPELNNGWTVHKVVIE